MALLQSFSNITRATRHAAQNILSHPLAKPIVPHLPDPVKSLVNANGEWEWGSWVEKGGVGEFESARVYLARWARVVAEEGERARRQESQTIPSSGDAGEESSSLGIFELLHNTSNLPTPKTTRNPKHPVDTETWLGWFDDAGRPKVSKEEMRKEVFGRGISPIGDLRRTVWPFLLGVYEWDATTEERDKLWEDKRYITNLSHVYGHLRQISHTESGTTNSETNGVGFLKFSRDRIYWRRDIGSMWIVAARIGLYPCLPSPPHLLTTKRHWLDTLSSRHKMAKSVLNPPATNTRNNWLQSY